MIRVAVVIGKMNSGGKKNLVMEYYRHIDKSKIQFDFICDSDSQAIPEDEIKNLGGKIYRIAPYQHPFHNIRDIYNLCKRNQYPIIHAYNSTMNVLPMIAGKFAGVPVRISESLSMAHNGELKTVLKKVLRQFSKVGATNYMACGTDCGKWQFGNKLFSSGKVSIFKTAINTKANSFNPELRSKTRKDFNLDNKIVIGHIGRFVKQKNPLFLIDIVNEIFKLDSRAELLLIGDGEEKHNMFKKIQELGIQDKIMYLGRREDIQQFYNAMDAFVLPSLYEGLPVVGLEAQSCGLPMFFSTEVTEEAKACELGHFISLEASPQEWARKILMEINKNMPIRRSHAKEVCESGFDSFLEAKKLQEYYIRTLEYAKGKKA